MSLNSPFFSFYVLKIFIFLLIVYGYFACSVSVQCACALGDQNWTSHLWELELHITVSHHVGAGNQAWVLWKSSPYITIKPILQSCFMKKIHIYFMCMCVHTCVCMGTKYMQDLVETRSGHLAPGTAMWVGTGTGPPQEQVFSTAKPSPQPFCLRHNINTYTGLELSV